MLKPISNLYFRPSLQAQAAVPLSARSVGHVIRGFDYIDIPPRPADLVQLFWGIAGTGVFTMNGQDYVLEPGQVCAYPFQAKRAWRSSSDAWNVRWITVDGSSAAMVFDMFRIQHEPHTVGACPQDLFIALEECIQDPTPDGERQASAAAYAIIAAASQQQHAEKKQQLITRALELIDEHGLHAYCNVDWLALELGTDRSYLSRQFKQHKGTSPSRFIESLRFQQAIKILRTTDQSMRVVAEATGFNDAAYFCRAFRRVMGMSPGSFRSSGQS